MRSKQPFAFALLALASACAAEDRLSSFECTDLPGDRDCVESDGAKGDAWDERNDPVRIASDLHYVLSELPARGATKRAVWAETYWPTYEGSTNHRWQGPTVLSPIEKYDATFNSWTPNDRYADLSEVKDCGPNAQRDFTAYVETLGPAGKFQARAQGRSVMFDGTDNDEDGLIDECASWGEEGRMGESSPDYDGVATWWGLCHAWSPAAILEPEPLYAVERDGQRFEVSDIKALLITAYNATESVAVGGRCNARTIEHDEHGRVTDSACADINAGTWHVVITNLLGLRDQPFVEDRTVGSEVWNQPVIGYEVTKLDERTKTEAIALVANESDAMPATDYTLNMAARKWFEVEMRVDWLSEGSASVRPLGMANNTRSDTYHYLLELDDDGKILGGEWLEGSKGAHPDFAWLPRRALRPQATDLFESSSATLRGSNPSVDLEKIHELLEASRSATNPGLMDTDRDGHCLGGADVNDDGDCADEGEVFEPRDCDDADAALRPGAEEICDNGKDDDCDGALDLSDDGCGEVADRDDDGYCEAGRDTNDDGDCADEGERGDVVDCVEWDAAVNPGAQENCEDEKDNDCDGDVDLDDATCSSNADRDGDGYCPTGRDLDHDGLCDAEHEPKAPTDCDDTNDALNPEALEVCDDGKDNDCNGDADARDSRCASGADLDSDGYCEEGRDGNGDGDCADDGESDEGFDCDEDDAAVNSGADEICDNGRDDNCNGRADTTEGSCVPEDQIDGDRDGYCPAGRDGNRDGDCADRGEQTRVADCDDDEPGTHPGAPETCDEVDNDCSGTADDSSECTGGPGLEAPSGHTEGGGCSISGAALPTNGPTGRMLVHAAFLALIASFPRLLRRVLKATSGSR